MSGAAYLARSHSRGDTAPAASMGLAGLAAHGLVVAAAVFNCVLCFVATRGVHVGLPIIAGCELFLVAAAWAMALRATEALIVPALLVALNLAALDLIAPGLDVKIGVDLAIAAGFVLLGRGYGDRTTASRLVFWLAVLTLAVGLYEMFALPSFEKWFHVYDYYVSKGDLDAAHASDTGTRLAENGVRPEDQGRQLLAGLLSLHRVGSIFLEPVSAGNFAAICAAFVIATRDWRLRGVLTLVIGLAIGVLADARFAILSAVSIGFFLMTPLWRSRWLVAFLPVLAIGALMVLGGTSDHEVDNTIMGRLTGSGQLLDDWTVWRWLGMASAREISMDTGYSYVIGNLGVMAAVLVWVAACVKVPRAGAVARLFAAAAVYVTLSLCISTSCLSIKTGALLWFCIGALWHTGSMASLRLASWRPAPAGIQGSG